MKKYFSIILTLLLIISFSACGNKSPEKQYDNFNFIADFSNTQGYKGWYYLYGSSEEPEKMIYDIDDGIWRGRDFYCRNEIKEQHPGNNSETIIGFKASKNGTISVEGSVTRCPADWSGDGVFFYIAYFDGNKLEEDYIHSMAISATEKKPYDYNFTKAVKKGSFVYFTINANANNSFDSVKNEISIKYI